MTDEEHKDRTVTRLAELYSESEAMLAMNARIKELKVELGKERAYIMELEEERRLLKAAFDEKCATIARLESGEGIDMKLIRKQKQQALIDNRVAELLAGNKSLASKNKKLQETNKDLLYQLIQLQNQKTN